MKEIDEAIKHCLEVAENNEQFASGKWIGSEGEANRQECEQCAADHRQLAEWLTELKEWKENPFLQIRTECRKNYYCNNCTFINHCPFAKWLTELREAKRLLKAAVEDLSCGGKNNKCTKSCKTCTHSSIKGYGCRYYGEYHWRYADEALKLIGGSENENNK